jgi:hypothetical protein
LSVNLGNFINKREGLKNLCGELYNAVVMTDDFQNLDFIDTSSLNFYLMIGGISTELLVSYDDITNINSDNMLMDNSDYK